MIRVVPALAVVALLFAGCADDGNTDRDSTTTVPQKTAPAPEKPNVPTGAEAVSYVETYYDLVDEKRFGRAWPYLPSKVQEEVGGFESWRVGHATTVSTRVDTAEMISRTGKNAVIFVMLRSRDRNPCGELVGQTFEGEWSLIVNGEGWIAEDLDIAKTGGGDPTLATNCSDPPPPEPPPAPEAPEPSNCTPGYSPCLEPAYDYDCADGGGDGPAYVYGTVSVSGSDPYGLDADGNGIGCEPYP